MRSAFSNTVTECPARFNCCAAANPAGPDPTTATRLPVRCSGRLRLDPAFAKGVLDDGLFDHLDGDRRFIDAQHASRFAGRGTDAPGEFRKIVGGVQHADGLAPAIAIDQIVPIGNDVVQRAAGMAKRHAAIHAARALGANFVLGKILIDFEPVVDALDYRPALGRFPAVFDKAGDFTHARPRAA